MVYGTYNELVTGANLNQLTSLGGFTLYIYIQIQYGWLIGIPSPYILTIPNKGQKKIPQAPNQPIGVGTLLQKPSKVYCTYIELAIGVYKRSHIIYRYYYCSMKYLIISHDYIFHYFTIIFHHIPSLYSARYTCRYKMQIFSII